jgi:hypothetical protein
MPCDSLSCPADESLENGPGGCMGRPGDVFMFVDLELRSDVICPLVLRMAPVPRSRTTVALTPDFLDNLVIVSSSTSCPAAYQLVSAILDVEKRAYRYCVCHADRHVVLIALIPQSHVP